MPPALEAFAQALVASGKLRIATDHERNFVKFGTSDSDRSFSARELTDPTLAASARAEIARHVPRGLGVDGVNDKIEQLKNDLKKGGKVSTDKEMKVARVLVQSAHPAVIQLLLASGAEIFVSYAHNVSDLMALHFWQGHGQASGMQSTEREGAAVYVSCGGDPFFEGAQKTYETDGFPALARMVVIAGQELGHFSDLIHTADGVILGRYSTDNASSQLRASSFVQGARRTDIRNVEALRRQMIHCGLALLLRAEHGVKFYAKRLKFSPPWIFYQCWRCVAWLTFITRGSTRPRLRLFPPHRCGEALSMFLSDMAFNLAPDADVYRREDPLEEEAIACIEALARVPQQVHKWGYDAVVMAWPELTRVYYGTIIPGTLAALPAPPPSLAFDIVQDIVIALRRTLRKRPGYYPDKA